MAETRRRKETPATEPIRGASVETDAQEHALPPEPKASVMLIAHNQSIALRRALQALFASPAAGQFEVIVIDCASDDDPRAVGDAFPQATFLYLPDDFGATKAMNIAARSAKSAALFFVAPEIEISAEAVLQLAEHLETHSGDTAAVCPLLTKPDGEVAGQALPLPSRETLARACAGEAAT